MGLFGLLGGGKKPVEPVRRTVQKLGIYPRTLETLLTDPNIGEAIRIGPGASVYPLYVARGYDFVVVTWDYALQRRSVEINATGGIENATVTNKSDYPLLLPAGVVLTPRKQGEQSRIINQSSIIPPKSNVPIQSLSCVYPSGGTRETGLELDRQLYAFPSVRVRTGNQNKLWQHIENVGSTGIFDDVSERKNLSSLLASDKYQRAVDSYLAGLQRIPETSKGGSILGHLIVYIDPETNQIQTFLEGYGNSTLYLDGRGGLMRGAAGQGVVSEPTAKRLWTDVAQDVRPIQIAEIVTAFARTQLNNPYASPAADYGTKINATLYEGKPVHFEGSGMARR